MKCSLVFTAVLASIAAIHAAPVVRENTTTYIRKQNKRIRERFVAKINGPKKVYEEIINRLLGSADEAKAHLQRQLNKVAGDLREAYKVPAEVVKNPYYDKLDVACVKGLTNKISEISQTIVHELKQQTLATTENAKETLIVAKKQLFQSLIKLK